MLVGDASTCGWPETEKVGVSWSTVLPVGIAVPLIVSGTAVLPEPFDACTGAMSVTANVSTSKASALVDHPPSGLVTVTATGPEAASGATVAATLPAVVEPPESVTAPKLTPL